MYGRMRRAFILLMAFQLLSLCRSQGASKRIPLGFQGMRGKKSFEYTDSEHFTGADVDKKRADDLDALTTNVDPESLLLDSFVPDEYFSDRVLLKRAPIGFMGMRGKKYTGGFEDDSFFLDSDPYNFMSFDNEMTSDKALEYNNMLQNHFAPFEHFLHPPTLNFGEDSLSKPFRYWDNNLIENHFFGPSPSYTGKPVLEDVQQGTENELVEDKRALRNGFFGMRGKKNAIPLLGRGKKGPFDYSFRGKFVGVRGKKSLRQSDNPLLFLIKRLHNQLYLHKRRVPDGFLGMRGKKWIKSVLSAPTTNPFF